MYSPYQNFAVVDVETGGLLTKEKKAVYDIALTEIAIVIVDSNLEIVHKDSWLIKPYNDAEYQPGAEKVSGISKKMCEEDGVDIEFACKEFIKVAKKYKVHSKPPTLVGHNYIKFDKFFVENFLAYCGEDINKYFNKEPEDTIKFARMKKPEASGYSLGESCVGAEINLVQAHRALPDTIATAELWISYLKGLRGLNSPKKSKKGKKEKPEKRFRQKFEI